MSGRDDYAPEKPRAGKFAGRGRLVGDIVAAMIVLRRGRWTMLEFAAELGMHWRAAYRLIAVLRAAGVTIERSAEAQGQGRPSVYYQIPAEPLRKLLHL